jgi:hypothetical protein
MAHSGLRVKDFEPKLNTNDASDNVGGFAFGGRMVVLHLGVARWFCIWGSHGGFAFGGRMVVVSIQPIP